MPSIRPIALAAPCRGNDLLVLEYHDPTKAQTSTARWEEASSSAKRRSRRVRRELHEELGVELLDMRRVGVLESIFHGFGRDGQEIVIIFGCRLASLMNSPTWS